MKARLIVKSYEIEYSGRWYDVRAEAIKEFEDTGERKRWVVSHVYIDSIQDSNKEEVYPSENLYQKIIDYVKEMETYN